MKNIKTKAKLLAFIAAASIFTASPARKNNSDKNISTSISQEYYSYDSINDETYRWDYYLRKTMYQPGEHIIEQKILKHDSVQIPEGYSVLNIKEYKHSDIYTFTNTVPVLINEIVYKDQVVETLSGNCESKTVEYPVYTHVFKSIERNESNILVPNGYTVKREYFDDIYGTKIVSTFSNEVPVIVREIYQDGNLVYSTPGNTKRVKMLIR